MRGDKVESCKSWAVGTAPYEFDSSRSQRRGEKPGCEIGRDSWPEEGRSYGPKTDLQIIDWSGIGRNDCTRYHEGTV